MTYFELVEVFDNLINKPRDENIFNKIEDASRDFNGNILGRFIDRIKIFINTRLDKDIFKISESIYKSQSVEELNLDLIEFMKEINYLKEFSNFSILPVDEKNNINVIIDKRKEDVINNLLEISNNLSNDELINLIKSYK